MSVFIFLIVLVVLILVHEFGHFIVAKWSGVRVDEFGIGFPPKLFGVRRGETEYTINALPFGGFVKIFGEDADEKTLRELAHDPNASRSLTRKPKLIQAAIIVAGVFSNILLGWFLFSVGFMFGFPMSVSDAPRGAEVANSTLTITGTEKNSPAEKVGLKAGDQILYLKSGDETLRDVTTSGVQSFVSSRVGREVTVGLRRGTDEITKTLVPREGIIPDRAALGISMDMIGNVHLSPLRALWEGAKLTIVLSWLTALSFAHLVVGIVTGTADFSGIAGPVGIIGLVGDAAQFGFVYLLGFVAIISVNLAVINIIPFPALDGGRLFFLIIEWIKGSPLNPRIINTVHTVGFFLLIALLLLVTWSDISKLL